MTTCYVGFNPKAVVRKHKKQMPKFYNVCTRKTIITDTEERNVYHKVGVIKVTQNGGWFLQLYWQPETDFMIFPNHKESLPVIEFDSDES